MKKASTYKYPYYSCRTKQRFQRDSSDVSNPKSDFEPQVVNRTERDGYKIPACPEKRKHSDEQNTPKKRLKKPIEEADSSMPWRIRLNETTTKPKEENQNRSIRELIAKAKTKLQEKRLTVTDNPKTDIATQRINARLARDQIVRTVDFENPLEYLKDLQKLGCEFIDDEVKCLNTFTLLPTRKYCTDESNSILGKNNQTQLHGGEESKARSITTFESYCQSIYNMLH